MVRAKGNRRGLIKVKQTRKDGHRQTYWRRPKGGWRKVDTPGDRGQEIELSGGGRIHRHRVTDPPHYDHHNPDGPVSVPAHLAVDVVAKEPTRARERVNKSR